MKSLFNVGDTVTLIDTRHSNYKDGDYPYGLLDTFLKSWGGKQGKIIRVSKNILGTTPKLYTEEYVYNLDFEDIDHPSRGYTFSALAFKECNCITPGREYWDILWTRRYPDVIFNKIKKNATVNLGIAASLSGCFTFDNTSEGGEFWDKVYHADMKQFKECITWLMTNFPQDFFIANSTIFTNNLTINQNENQLQGTKIDLRRDENSRGTICVYSENRPRVTICPLSYTAVGYRNGIKISRYKN